jgi:hypothetical protein
MSIKNYSDLIFKKKYYKYKSKYLDEKNKLTGGLTLKNGLYAFFTNKAYYNYNQALNNKFIYKEKESAPSIFDLRTKLATGCYMLENNTDKLELLQSPDTKDWHISSMPIIITSSDKRKIKGNDISSYFPQSKKVNLENDQEIIKLGQLINDLDLFLTFRVKRKVGANDAYKAYPERKIDYCLIIEVNNLFPNKYIKAITIPAPIPNQSK